jgi:23S rRNA (cytosine1962-C5)-methyltransferase
MTVWRLKKGADRRLRQGHPWAFASELAHSAKEIAPGEPVELRDAADNFIAFGYGHPSSQIAFRKLSSRSRETDVLSVDFFVRRLRTAREVRAAAGWCEFSHRWLYAEADGVPGLIIDAFLVGVREWMVVVQASTAGADRALPAVFEALAAFESEFGRMTVIEAPSSRARVLEGLAVGEKRVVKGDAESLADVPITLMDGLSLHCDLLHGQKTGFFLDQQWNASLLKRVLRSSFGGAAGAGTGAGAGARGAGPVRVLDICCYVGQWAAHSAQALRSVGAAAEVSLLDTSSAALGFAERNVRALGVEHVTAIEGDAMEALSGLEAASFDVVICDPPAFVKKKADLENGLRAYTKLNREALKLVKPGGVFVASSCSGLVKQADFSRVLLDSSMKAGRTFKQLLAGGHGPDHPVRPEFPEGEYLKCVIGRPDTPF